FREHHAELLLLVGRAVDHLIGVAGQIALPDVVGHRRGIALAKVGKLLWRSLAESFRRLSGTNANGSRAIAGLCSLALLGDVAVGLVGGPEVLVERSQPPRKAVGKRHQRRI